MPDFPSQNADEIEDFNTDLADWVPAKAVAEEIENKAKIQNPDWVVCMCTECGSEVDERRAERNPFVQSGQSMPCPYCGAPCILTFGELKGAIIDRVSARRGAF